MKVFKNILDYIDILSIALKTYFLNVTLTWNESWDFAKKLVKGFK